MDPDKYQDLHERIKDRRVIDVSANLWNQISRKGHQSHKIIGTNRQHLFLYGLCADDLEFNPRINYEDFKKQEPERYEIHLEVLKECLDAGFKI